MKKTNVQIKFPAQFAGFINHIETLEFEGDRLEDFINSLDVTYGNIRERLFDGDGQIRPYINLFIGKKNINALQGVNSIIPEGERISLLLSRAGG